MRGRSVWIWVGGFVCGAVLIAGIDQRRSVATTDQLGSITARLEHLEAVNKAERPALIFVSKAFDSVLESSFKVFDIAELLSSQPNGNYILCGKILSGDATGSPPNNVLMARMQFSEIFVSKSGEQIDCFVMNEQILTANGQGFELDNSNGKLVATCSGRRYVSLVIWRCVGE